MTMYPWRAGERITAQRLRAGVQTGVASVDPDNEQVDPELFSANYYRGETDVTFDAPFTSTPVIQVTPRSSVPGNTMIEATYTNQSSTGFTVVIARRTQTTTNVDWVAIGEPDLS